MELIYKRKPSCWVTMCTRIKPHYTYAQTQGEKCLLNDSNMGNWRVSSNKSSIYWVNLTNVSYLLGGFYFALKIMFISVLLTSEYELYFLYYVNIYSCITEIYTSDAPRHLWEKLAWVIILIYWSSGPSDLILKWNWVSANWHSIFFFTILSSGFVLKYSFCIKKVFIGHYDCLFWLGNF